MARWAGEIISKHPPGEDGKTLYERIRKEACQVSLVRFGESVMYLPMKTVHTNRGEPIRKQGLWLGVIERTEETSIGTPDGVIKCRTMNRLPKGNQWDPAMIFSLKGVPWEPIPGKESLHIPVDIEDDGKDPEGDCGRAASPANNLDAETPIELRGGTDKLHISRKAIAKSGVTTGCACCNDLARRGHNGGKLIYHHSGACRTRIIEHMRDDPEYRRLLEKHGYTMAMSNGDAMTKEQIQEKIHQMKKAIMEIEKRQRQTQRSAKENQINSMMRSILLNQVDVAEVCNPPRIAEMARKIGLRAGWRLDLTTCDEHGKPWDFNCSRTRNAVVRKLMQDRPRMLIGNPMCHPFNCMNNINYSMMSDEERQQRIAYGRKHLEFCAKLYEIQWKEGRYFLHEHPELATPWSEQCITNLLRKQG